VDVRDLLAAVWRRKLLAFFVLLVELGATAAFLALAPRIYESTATVSASPSQESLRSTGNLATLQATVARLVTTGDVLDKARLRISPSPSLATMKESVSGTLVTGTVLVRVTARHEDPQLAARIANAVAAELPLHDPSDDVFTYATVDTARPGAAPVSPNTRLIVVIGVALGLALAVAAALLQDNAARRVDTADDVRQHTEIGVLARVPRPRDRMALDAAEPDSRAAAAFRALRIALEFVAAREPLPALVVTSAVPDDSEGWFAANLAVALAQVQHRVLLVDGNLLSPRTHPALAAPGKAGLAEVLAGAPTESLLIDGPVPNLSVLPAGNAPAQMAELVETRFGEVLQGWTREYDVVLVDAPAVTSSDDARVMAVAGAILLSVPGARVSPRTLREVAASLRVVNARVAGAVLLGGDPT
jgi:Mrp family chromosome partitioning ATPase